MCRALRVLCAGPGPERLSELRRACVSAVWELVGGVSAIDQLAGQLDEWRPDVVVIDAELGPEAAPTVRRVRPTARLVGVGPVPGADASAASIQDVREAVLGLPRPGGPVRM
jgi:hypothetical protein